MTDELGKRLSALSPDRIQALVKELHTRDPSSVERVPKMPRNPEQRYPLSSAQERMWFLSQLSPESRALNNPGALRATRSDPLNREWFEEAVREVAHRHEILRTTFHSDGGRPWQVIHDELPPTLMWHDLRDLPGEERERRAQEIALNEGRRAFALETGPLLAFTIVQLGETEYLLLNTTHHIVSDGWTNAILSREVAAAYGALESGNPNSLPPPPFQYVDYVAWEAEWLKGEEAREQLRRWKERLATEVPLALPADHPRPGIMTHAGGLESLRLPADLTESLQSFAREERVSLFQLLMAAFSALLHRQTGQQVITVGTVTANRNLREFQNVMGLFINTVVVRSEVDGRASFRDYLRQVQTLCQDAVKDQEYPFAGLVGELNPHRTLNTHPIFQVMLVHQNVPAQYEVPGMRLEILKVDYQTAKFDLNLWTEEIGDELALTLYFSRDLFEVETARRLLGHLRAVLESVLSDAGRPVGSLHLGEEASPIPTPASSMDTRSDGEEPPLLHRRFEAQATNTPDSQAVEGHDGSLTYRELDARANQLARHILLSVGQGDAPIALLLSPSILIPVAILAILKAGRAYVALDPSYPAERMRTVLGDSGAELLLSERELEAHAAHFDLRTVYLDSHALDIARLTDAPLDAGEVPGRGSDSLAYIVYTSGSTGLPKGVQVEHRNLVHYCDSVWPVLGLGVGNRFATVTSIAADLGNTMIFPPLLNGGCVVLVPGEVATDAVELPRFLEVHAVDCLKVVPSHLRALLGGSPVRSILPRKLLVLGGEECPATLVARVRGLAPELRILNHYGPSETTVGVLAWEIPPGEVGDEAVPLGSPLGDAQVHVLNAGMCPVPAGIQGEIFVGGPTVARGYLDREELTQDRFLPDPWSEGGRLYRTGDLAKRRDDGAIVFLGRVDRQIKIRGFRVELGEVEQAVASHPDVAQAVILPPREGDARQQLTAFVQRETSGTVGAAGLTAYLRGRLPAYMIPAVFAFPKTIPLTGNGKVDYGALAKQQTEPARRDHTPPRDNLELELVRMWRELLEREELGIDDGFFDLGGHSLLAVRLMAEIHGRFGQHLSLATLFEHGTIRALAHILRTGGASEDSSALVPIQPQGQRAPLFFVHPAGGNVLCYYELSRELGDSVPFWGLQAPVTGGSQRNPGSIRDMARAYLDAMLAVDAGAAPVLGGWSMGALVAFEIARIYQEERGTAPTVVILDQLAPGDEGEVGAFTKDPEGVPDDRTSRLLTFSDKVSELVGEDLGVTAQALTGMSPVEQAGVLLERFKAFDLAPETTVVRDFSGFLDLMLEHNRITAEYGGEVYGGRVVVFRAEERISGAGTDRPVRLPELGWQRLSRHPVEIVATPGSHVSMMRSPHVQLLARRLAAVLWPED